MNPGKSELVFTAYNACSGFLARQPFCDITPKLEQNNLDCSNSIEAFRELACYDPPDGVQLLSGCTREPAGQAVC